MDEISVKMEIEKETKNTIRYAAVVEDGKPPAVKTVYIEKWAVGERAPNYLTITITE